MVRADSLSYRGFQLLAIDAKYHTLYAESAALYARAYALRPSEPSLMMEYGEYLLEMRRPRYALAIGDRLLAHPDMSTNARALTVYLNATGRVWGTDSVLVAAQRLYQRAPSARAALSWAWRTRRSATRPRHRRPTELACRPRRATAHSRPNRSSHGTASTPPVRP